MEKNNLDNFFTTQVLGMQWLSDFIRNLLLNFKVDLDGKFGGSLHFFIYDVLKITILLCVLIFLISYIQSYLSPLKSKKILGKFKGIFANIIAALLGTVTPFCSCSSIPLFIGFSSAGLPLSVTLSFLISSPMVDLGSLVLLSSIFGIKIAVIYVIVGLVIAVLGGSLLGNLDEKKYIQEYILSIQNTNLQEFEMSQKDRVVYAKEQTFQTFKKVFFYIIVGVAIGAYIHNWIPQDFIQNLLGKDSFFGVIVAVLVGAPMYADIFGVIPIAEALYLKGATLGVVLSFMMAVTTLSLPSMIMLSRAMKPKLLALFIGYCVISIVMVGYIFNIFEKIFI
ncbi:permease [Campylobacter sp. RM12327]|uniref:permease n=1 Tax=Campylobacter sputorum TaxID=206 RepID=UPI000B7770E8|nr:arsenic resistance permease [Campylobacter sputorum]MBE7357614.1 permease [Campylobacter sp. RM11302]MBF6669260.1 permease [Campylobacter sp. RM12327]MBF6674529.1 permease [Campylobacter sp. RM13538]MBF6675482.1 permease [Campylobacter sp. RM12321]MBF6677126.1 permease [Campylobacter sp. RM11259]